MRAFIHISRMDGLIRCISESIDGTKPRWLNIWCETKTAKMYHILHSTISERTRKIEHIHSTTTSTYVSMVLLMDFYMFYNLSNTASDMILCLSILFWAWPLKCLLNFQEKNINIFFTPFHMLTNSLEWQFDKVQN